MMPRPRTLHATTPPQSTTTTHPSLPTPGVLSTLTLATRHHPPLLTASGIREQ